LSASGPLISLGALHDGLRGERESAPDDALERLKRMGAFGGTARGSFSSSSGRFGE
jgi:hypothetical protein